jgi:glycosyltransferase involved in cell wall biosynthesis
MPRLVTIAIPIYHRLHLLPGALRSVADQDYPDIELLVSDNGGGGSELEDIIRRHYPRPFRIRRNAETEPVMSRHFNQMLEAATGDYFVLLCDDDEISPRFVSELAGILDSDPTIGLALPRVEVLDEDGTHRPRAGDERYPPAVFSGADFVRMWAEGGYCFWNFATVMARTDEMREIGGYPMMPNGDDNAVALRLALGRKVGFSPEAVFRNRWYESSAGLAVSPWELAEDIKTWLTLLDADPVIRRFAEANPGEWAELRRLARGIGWRTYRHRYKTMYRQRLGRLEWLRAGFALPFVPEYYRWLVPYLLKQGLVAPRRLFRQRASTTPDASR